MEIAERRLFVEREETKKHIEVLNRTVHKRRICTVFGSSGSGKTALCYYWQRQLARPGEVIYIELSPPSPEYRSSAHMVYARTLERLLDQSRPSYVPARSSNGSDTNQFGRKQLEKLRKDTLRELNTRPVSTLVVDRIEHVDQPGLDAVLELRFAQTAQGKTARRALVLVGQQKKHAREESVLPTWLKRQAEAFGAWTERLDIERPTLAEIRGSKERPGLFRRLLEEGINVRVAEDENRVQINQELGTWVTQTNRNMGALVRLVNLLDDEAEAQPGSTTRLITLGSIERVKGRLERLANI